LLVTARLGHHKRPLGVRLRHHNSSAANMLCLRMHTFTGALRLSETARHTTQGRSNHLSYPRLPKTGIFPSLARDYRRFLALIVEIGDIETEGRSAKDPIWRVLF
jgi:hypothetical protein